MHPDDQIALVKRCLLLVLTCLLTNLVMPTAWAQPASPAAGPLADPPAPADSAPSARFPVWEYAIAGNTVLPVQRIEAAVTPFLGAGKAFADLEGARASLEKAYQDAGFLTVFVDIPEQDISSGVVELRVLEGRVANLWITGARYYDQGVIRERLPELQAGTVPDFNRMQGQIAALSLDARRLQPVLKPGRTPGTVDVELKVDDKLPFSASLELNNRHAPDTDPLRAALTLRYDNLFQREHSISLTAVTAPRETSQSQVLALNYALPLSADTNLVLYGVVSNSEIEPLGALTVFGKGTTLGLRWLRTVSTGGASHTLGAGVDYKDLKEDAVVTGSAAVATPLRYLPFQLSYSGNWFGQRWRAGVNTAFVVASRQVLPKRVDCPVANLPGELRRDDQFNCKREGLDGSFAYWRGDASWTRALDAVPGSLQLRLGWQLTPYLVPPAEQGALGGADTVRGYLEAEAAGDQMLRGSVEWRSPNLARWLVAQPTAPEQSASTASAPWLDDFTLLGFVDAGSSYVNDPTVGQAARVPLLSAGMGLRLRARQRFNADIDLAWPFKSTTYSANREAKVHVRVAAEF